MIEAKTQMTIEANKVIDWLNEGIRSKELTQMEIIEGLPVLCVHILQYDKTMINSLILLLEELIQ